MGFGCADDIVNNAKCDDNKCNAMFGGSACSNVIEDKGKTLHLGWAFGGKRMHCMEPGGWKNIQGDHNRHWWQCGDGGCDGTLILEKGRPMCRTVQCPDGSHLKNGLCVKKAEDVCPAGFHRTGSGCSKTVAKPDFSCPSGYKFDASSYKCLASSMPPKTTCAKGEYDAKTHMCVLREPLAHKCDANWKLKGNVCTLPPKTSFP